MIRIIEVRQERGHQVCLVLDGAEDVRIDRRVWEAVSYTHLPPPVGGLPRVPPDGGGSCMGKVYNGG